MMQQIFLSCLVLALPTAVIHAQVEQLSVMSFNVWEGEDNAAGITVLKNVIQAGNADIVGLQEMRADRIDDLANALGFHSHQLSTGRAGWNVILSRYPIVGQSTSNLGARIQVSPAQNVWLFDMHLTPFSNTQPFQLRNDYDEDGVLSFTEEQIIADANSARGNVVTQYLDEITPLLNQSEPVFLVGDFNEPSFQDWTQAAADNTPRLYDLAVEWPATKRLTDSGMADAFREVRPDEVNDPGYTWSPGYPPPILSPTEAHDRIDFVFYGDSGTVTPISAQNIGYDINNINTDLAVTGYNSDHRAVVVNFMIPASSLSGDFDFDGDIDGADWTTYIAGLGSGTPGATDLTGDGVNNYADFVQFKELYESYNGVGSFAQLGHSVPEPTGLVLAAICIGASPVVRRRAGASRMTKCAVNPALSA